MTDLSRYYPLSGTETINGVFYSWDFMSRSLGTLHYGENHEPLKTVNVSETNDDFKHYLRERALEHANSEQGTRDRARKRALEILETDNPPKFILDTFKTQHIGDNETAEGILVGTANQSIANSKGIQSAVRGESGRGKSHAARAMLHLFPECYFMVASLSNKALFYLETDKLRPGMTIFSDDARLSEGIEDIIKRSTAFFQEPTVNMVATKEGGKWITKELTIPPRLDWLLTSVATQGSEQLVNRQIGFDVDETPEQDEKVAEFELVKAREGLPEFELTEDVLTCREILLNIKEDETGTARLFTVKIPFAERIEWLDKANRRNLPLFLDMVKGYAVLNFKQRLMVDGALIATEADFHAAERLYNRRGGFQRLHINEREKQMVQHIHDSGGELATDELMDKLKLSRTRVRQLAERLETILPSFYVEKRTESVRDSSDDGKSTTRQKNYYCYQGAVTVESFGSIVSLRDPDPEDEQEHLQHLQATCRPLAGVKTASGLEKKEAQNEHLHQKEANNKNIIYNKEGSEKAGAEQNKNPYARAYIRAETASAREGPQKEAGKMPIAQSAGAEGLDQKLQVGSIRPVSEFTTQNLLAEDVQAALVQVKNGEDITIRPGNYNEARSLVYTLLQGHERYNQLDGVYYKERFDFLAATHTGIAGALREIVPDEKNDTTRQQPR